VIAPRRGWPVRSVTLPRLSHGRESHAPGQPGGAGAEAVAPAATSIKLTDQIEEAGSRRIEMRGQLGDLVANLSSSAVDVTGVITSAVRVLMTTRSGKATLHLGFEAT
jgi:hypothetical protein